MRLIDADRLMERIRTLPNAGIHWFVSAEAVFDEILNAPTVEIERTEWIPCSERLPKKEERRYWICLDSGGQCQCRWTNNMYGLGANEYSKWGWHIMDKPQYSIVVAWMPLPEPYGGEQE